MVQRLTRAQWGALPPKRPQTPMLAAGGVAIHYEGPRMGAYSHDQCIGKVRGIQRFHMNGTRDNWKDVAYNEIVCRHGVRFECRGYRAQSGANGSSKANATAYAICALMGEGDDVTPELVAGIADAAADYRRNGAGPTVWGHRDFIATACPGDPLYALVKSGAFSSNTPPNQEDSMSAAEVQELKEYIKDLLIDGYTVNGKAFPGVAAVDIESQRRVTRLEGALSALAAGLGPAVQEAVRKALSEEYDATVELTPKKGAAQ